MHYNIIISLQKIPSKVGNPSSGGAIKEWEIW